MRIELAAAEKPPYTDEKEPNKKNNNNNPYVCIMHTYNSSGAYGKTTLNTQTRLLLPLTHHHQRSFITVHVGHCDDWLLLLLAGQTIRFD